MSTMDEQVLFGTSNTTVLANLHNTTTSTVYSLRQSLPTCFQYLESANDQNNLRIFTTLQNKALLHVYNIQKSPNALGGANGAGSMGAGSGNNSSSSSHVEVNISQRIPLVEPMEQFVILKGKFFVGTSGSGSGVGGLYIWDMESGDLLKFHQGLHYQRINGFVVSEDEKFLLTYSDDSRCCIWEIRDLFTAGSSSVGGFGESEKDKLKPVAVLKDHSLPITRVEIVADHVFTSSLDMTVRCYGWIESGFSLIKTFVFSHRIHDFKLDAALRALYVVLDTPPQQQQSQSSTAVLQVPLLYNLSSGSSESTASATSDLKIVNLLNASQSQRMYTCTHIVDHEQGRAKLFQMNGQVECKKIYDGFPVSKIQLSLDNTVLLVGLKQLGKILCMDIFSKQILKELHSNDRNDVIDIQVSPIIKNNLGVVAAANNSNKNATAFKYPIFSKNLNDENEFSDLNVMNVDCSENPHNNPNIVYSDFEEYLNEYVSPGHFLFQQVPTNPSLTLNAAAAASSFSSSSRKQNTETILQDQEKDNKIQELQDTVEKLTKAYKDLRSMYSEDN
ncbi:hypothetical protein ACO0QE_000997 [Hanseniaspora vineae]